MKQGSEIMSESQIKSKERVSDHGEVFTNEREVIQMLDLVKDECERIESRFLEPACGTGNFVSEILRRKLETVKKVYGQKEGRHEFEKYSVLAVSSIYGIDIMEDNARECRQRLFDLWNSVYTKHCKEDVSIDCQEAVKYIINHNILYGDALTMLQNDGNPIVFSQWDLVMGDKLKRRDFRLDQLMLGRTGEMTLDMFAGDWDYDEETHDWIPAPIKEYPLTNYWEVQHADKT